MAEVKVLVKGVTKEPEGDIRSVYKYLGPEAFEKLLIDMVNYIKGEDYVSALETVKGIPKAVNEHQLKLVCNSLIPRESPFYMRMVGLSYSVDTTSESFRNFVSRRFESFLIDVPWLRKGYNYNMATHELTKTID
jgi:hypothetical protein